MCFSSNVVGAVSSAIGGITIRAINAASSRNNCFWGQPKVNVWGQPITNQWDGPVMCDTDGQICFFSQGNPNVVWVPCVVFVTRIVETFATPLRNNVVAPTRIAVLAGEPKVENESENVLRLVLQYLRHEGETNRKRRVENEELQMVMQRSLKKQ